MAGGFSWLDSIEIYGSPILESCAVATFKRDPDLIAANLEALNRYLAIAD